ncbi:hypothetical protein EDD16DRAFT_1853016 [Pisolithus croceorrhizus]|nr:hypothetical protein EDD16DRAFT_1853016 [Pisolithus croceorrhizus]
MCDKSFQTAAGLAARRQSKKHLFVCPICNQAFVTSEQLEGHRLNAHSRHDPGPSIVNAVKAPPPPPKVDSPSTKQTSGGPSCSQCNQRFPSWSDLNRHIGLSHGYSCSVCGERFPSFTECNQHFGAKHKAQIACDPCNKTFKSSDALQAHVAAKHPGGPNCGVCQHRATSATALEAHVNEVHCCTVFHPIFECHICRESYSAQSALADHISTAHSCPVCGEGVYVDAKALEEHQEEHRDPYHCVPCGTRYAEEGLLLQHYKESSNDVHPLCVRCDLGFENGDAYNIHVVEVHRPTLCEACEGLVVDQIDLPLHYLSSRRHPTCETCQMGFKDMIDYGEHGALQHPESHCYLCRWQFDSCDALQSHIRHFANHPKCVGCDLRFADVETYQHHLFAVHCPKDDDNTAASTTHVGDDEHQFALSSLADQYNRVVENQAGRGSEAYDALYASSIPLPPSASGYSSPTSQNVDSEDSTQPDVQSCSSTLIIDQPSPKKSELRPFVPPSLNVDTGKYADSYEEFNHSPLSMVPTVGTPLLSSSQTIPSVDYRSPFSPRPDGPPAFRATPVINGVAEGSVHSSDEDGSDSSFARSPPLISPGIKLPSPAAGSPTSSGWTSDSDSVTKLSLNSCVSSHPKSFSGTDKSTSALQVSDAGNSTRCMPASTSPTSPESARISISAVTQTPEYLREARAYLPLTHLTSRVSSPSVLHSPTNSSPILSSTGLALGDSGRRREVRFDDNIMSEPVWDHESTSSDASLDIPVTYRRPNGIHARKYGASKLPRFSSLKRKRFTNGKLNHSSAPINGKTFKLPAPSYHCRVCLKDSCDEPTTTTCGHLFCYECISNSIMDDPHCPECNAPTLLYCLFRMNLSA